MDRRWLPQDPARTAADARAHCKLPRTGCELPRIVEFLSDPLPKTDIGKPLRRGLRDAAPAAAGAG